MPAGFAPPEPRRSPPNIVFVPNTDQKLGLDIKCLRMICLRAFAVGQEFGTTG